MDIIFDFIREEMRKHKIADYHVKGIKIEVAASTTESIEAQNDFHFFADASCDTTLNGRIRGTGGGNSLDINAKNISTSVFKHQAFKGAVSIQNSNAADILIVEFLRVTPVFERIPVEN